MLVNLFGFDIDISLIGIIQFIIDNRLVFIPGILYLIFNNLIPMYMIIIIIWLYFIINQLSYNKKLSNVIKLLQQSQQMQQLQQLQQLQKLQKLQIIK